MIHQVPRLQAIYAIQLLLNLLGAVTGLGSLALPGTIGVGLLTHLMVAVCDITHLGFASPYGGRRVYTAGENGAASSGALIRSVVRRISMPC